MNELIIFKGQTRYEINENVQYRPVSLLIHVKLQVSSLSSVMVIKMSEVLIHVLIY